METFETVWRRLRLSVPGASPFLVQSWVRNAYRRLCQKRGWSWLVLEDQLTWGDARTVTCTTARGSATVTSAALFVSGDVGRQFRVGSYPIYTIQAVPSTGEITLDRTFQPITSAGAGAGVTGQILDAYATLPANFDHFVALLDPVNQRLVPWWMTWEELELLDPVRQAAESTPRLLSARRLSTTGSQTGRVQYEYWPKPTAAGALQYYAIGLPVDMADDDAFVGLLAARPDVLEAGALAEAARWPGTATEKNPYFNLGLAQLQDRRFEELAIQLDIRDDDVFQQSWSRIPWQRWSTWSWAYDTHLLQSTDADLSAYAGMGSFAAF